jgi:hypothetical protein
MRDFWDKRYSYQQYVYGIEPNNFFKGFLDSTIPGKLLLPAEGEGRNALYALRKGWEVNAVDQSDEGRKKAISLARASGFDLEYTVADLTFWDDPIGVDAIALIFAHFPRITRQDIHRKLIEKLNSGGHIILEAFSADQLRFNTGGPRNPELLYTPEMLEQDFEPIDIRYLEQLEIDIEEGDFHKGRASVVRLIGKKI